MDNLEIDSGTGKETGWIDFKSQLIVIGDNRGHPALTKRFDGFNSWLVLGPLRVEEQLKESLGFVLLKNRPYN